MVSTSLALRASTTRWQPSVSTVQGDADRVVMVFTVVRGAGRVQDRVTMQRFTRSINR
ncbi:Uncharacterised protein [Mycobacterium tuberculosis]|uniref:Uncharacterized protein n=1 Tax=Mycobacterium tuberculosis TaxID=1773 RepID=A0A916LDG4_MYCTX|nr:Uncharacterised protein [Mycobacterium tuberculosis]COZ20337.1 Uncharacterised protein [Mycobacterium tuberculosis]COZ45561.1 Uncharacterised protein [Mycobacterium tuberculosis]